MGYPYFGKFKFYPGGLGRGRGGEELFAVRTCSRLMALTQFQKKFPYIHSILIQQAFFDRGAILKSCKEGGGEMNFPSSNPTESRKEVQFYFISDFFPDFWPLDIDWFISSNESGIGFLY